MDKLFRIKQVSEIVGYKSRHILRLVEKGEFPGPYKLNSLKGGAVAWKESEIDAWINSRPKCGDK